jgi:GNAT superfamily N-acetyltransferase
MHNKVAYKLSPMIPHPPNISQEKQHYTAEMAPKITLRPATRADLPALALIANAANANSAIHARLARYQHEYPDDYYRWRLNILRTRFVSPALRFIVAEDTASKELLGFANWAVEGPNTELYKKWVGERTWLDWLEEKLLAVENKVIWYKSIDYNFTKKYLAGMFGPGKAPRPPCIHPHLVVVDPAVQARGVGRLLVEWGKTLAMQEDLPLYLESNLEATGFYEKVWFERLGRELVVEIEGEETLKVPLFAWEGKEREGRWLRREEQCGGGAEAWVWREDVLGA